MNSKEMTFDALADKIFWCIVGAAQPLNKNEVCRVIVQDLKGFEKSVIKRKGRIAKAKDEDK